VAGGISYNASDGHLLEPDSLRGDFNIITPSVSSAVKISEKINLAVRTAYDRRLFNARYFYTNSPFDQSREEVRKWWNQAALSYEPDDNNTIHFLAGYQTTRDSFLFNPAFPANIHRTHYHNYQVNHLYRSDNTFRIASGIQVDNRKVFSNDRGDRSHWHAGGYLVASRQLFNNLNLSGGLRIDYDQVYELELLPQVNLAWSTGTYTIRGSAGRSIRSPDFTERYISTGLLGPLSPGRNLGNPNLVSEKAWSLEAGYDRVISRYLQIRLTGFYRFSRDLVDYVMTPSEQIPENGNLQPGSRYFYARNIGLVNTGGIEAELNGRHSFAANWMLNWTLSYQGIIPGSDSAVVSKYLASHSRNLMNARLDLNTEGFRIRITAMYKNRDPEMAEEINRNLTNAYMLWNLRFDKYLWNNRLQLSLQVNNILDAEYSDILGARMPGRWIMGGLTWNFHR
jgi:iron complex outermembrane receptor protein